MSRILKRPMFRSGGSTNEGIMHGLVDRKGYKHGSEAERYRDEYMEMLAAACGGGGGGDVASLGAM